MVLVRASVLNQPHKFFIPHEKHTQIPQTDFPSSEQDCVSLIKQCKSLEEFKQVHGLVLKMGLLCSSYCTSSLLATCAISEWGSMDYACSVFGVLDDPGAFDYNVMIRGHNKDLNFVQALCMYIEMLDGDQTGPNRYTFLAVLRACAGLSDIGLGKQVHGQILKLGLVQELFVQNSLINMYGKCGDLSRSCEMFAQMDQKSIASWSALIAGHADSGSWDECLRLFREMNIEGCWRSEESTLVSVISACGHIGALDLGKSIHGHLCRNLDGHNVAIQTCLIDMYIKCGSLDEGMCLFRKMLSKNEKTYAVVIAGLASHGRSDEAIGLFEEMVEAGVKPDDVVYVGVLNACSHAGLVEKGMKFFDRMRFQDKIEPTIQHYGCVVDLLARAGMITEACNFIKKMPLSPNDVVWRSVLSSCKLHQNVELGEVAAENLFLLNTKNACDYLMLADLYARGKRWDDVKDVRTRMAREVSNRSPGCCTVEVKRKVYKFVSNDWSHRRRGGEIYEMIEQMEWQVRFEGYRADASEVVVDVDEEEKSERMKYHSQRLAIAFSLISSLEGRSPIRITRNVRMCSDCHRYTKLISLVYEREIVVRDRNMFHHFKDGFCSCKDYW